MELTLTSPAFASGGTIPHPYTSKGRGVSPPLVIAGVPYKAKSLALCMHDPNAPGGDYVHWLVWNIPVITNAIPEGATPHSAQEGTNSAGKTGYTPPAPPSGKHHYVFNLYALDKTLELPNTTNRTNCMAALQGHVLEQTSLIGTVAA